MAVFGFKYETGEIKFHFWFRNPDFQTSIFFQVSIQNFRFGYGVLQQYGVVLVSYYYEIWVQFWFWLPTKGGFFSESAMRFLDLQISKKNIPKSYPELEI